MKRDLRSTRPMFCAGLLITAAAGGCNAIIGLEVGELDASAGGAGATASSVSAGGAGGEGGRGEGGAGGGGAGEGGDGGTGGTSDGGAGGAGEGGAGGGNEALCSHAREGAVRPPSGEWGTLSGLAVVGLAARDGEVTALVKESRVLVSEPTKTRTGFSVARWNPSGVRESAYGMTTGDMLGSISAEHLAVASDLAYVAGWSEAPLTLLASGGSGRCTASAGADTGRKPSFLLALDQLGKCRWAWSVEAEHNAYPLGLAATADRVTFAVSRSGATSATTDDCVLGAADQRGVTDLVTFNAGGKCRWSRALGSSAAVHVAEVIAAPQAGEVLVVGDYDAPDGPLDIQGRTLPRAPDRDLFVARFRLEDGALTGLIPLTAAGSQAAARHGSALLPDGDIVVAGTYTGPSFSFEDDCPLLPPTGDTENSFVARVSKKGVVWSRGFGDEERDQMVVSLAVDGAGAIYMAGTLEGEIALGNGESLTARTDELQSFLIVLNPSGNVLSATAFAGTGTVGVWAVAPGATIGDPFTIGGELTETFSLVPSDHPSAAPGEGFIARVKGLP
ncbi:putative secreted protein [Sorangium cellulosum So ce56]|uniref:Secreted protein n=1 Tax=Sorangium cellulosum (strain So ce56) TaxID=448385 RepID=A9G3V6_SORC5|nr:hypothetical protein [Sorangium cellulosum]CAN95802.1 putative secreted protein [Sorangium cellulosum So ce56]